MTELEQLKSKYEEFKIRLHIAFQKEHELLLICHAENRQMRDALEKIAYNTVKKFDKSGINCSRNEMKTLANDILKHLHASRLAKRVELMEKVVLEVRRTVEDYKGSTALTKALDALDKDQG